MALDYFQTAPWFHIAFGTDASDPDMQVLGSRNKATEVANPLEMLSSFSVSGGNSSNNGSISPTLTNTVSNIIEGIITNAANQSGWTGILGNIDSMLFFNVTVNRTVYTHFINQTNSTNQTQQLFQNDFTLTNLSATGFNLTGLQPLPWFNDTILVTDDQLDDLISNDILTNVHLLTSVNASTVTLGFWEAALFRYPKVAAAIQAVSNMPWGILRFESVQNGSYSYMIQAGTDSRLLNVASYPPEGLRRMAFQTLFSKSIRTFLFIECV